MHKLKEKWGVKETEDVSFEKKVALANGYLSSFMATIFEKSSEALFKFGIVGAA